MHPSQHISINFCLVVDGFVAPHPAGSKSWKFNFQKRCVWRVAKCSTKRIYSLLQLAGLYARKHYRFLWQICLPNGVLSMHRLGVALPGAQWFYSSCGPISCRLFLCCIHNNTYEDRFRCFQALQASCPSACLERFSHLFLLHIWKVLMFEPLLGHVNPQTVSSHMDVVHLEWCCCIFPMIHPHASGPFCSTCRHGVWEVCCSWSRMELESSLTRWAYWLASFARRIDRMTCTMDARVFVGSFVSLFN